MKREECEALLLELAADVVELARHQLGPQDAREWGWSRRPATHDDVAERLSMLGCRGLKSISCECPVAIFLKNHGSECADVSVGCCFFTPYDSVAPGECIDNFLLRFDDGRYPELVA